jgi:hypothetical protein
MDPEAELAHRGEQGVHRGVVLGGFQPRHDRLAPAQQPGEWPAGARLPALMTGLPGAPYSMTQASYDLAACAATVRGSRAASSPSGRAAVSFRLAPKRLDRTCMAGAAFYHPSWAGPGPSRYQMAG